MYLFRHKFNYLWQRLCFFSHGSSLCRLIIS